MFEEQDLKRQVEQLESKRTSAIRRLKTTIALAAGVIALFIAIAKLTDRSVTIRPAPRPEVQIDANKLRNDILKLDDAGATAVLDAARQLQVLKPEFDAEPQSTIPARNYLFHLVDVAARKDDEQAELRAWKAMVPSLSPLAAPTASPSEARTPENQLFSGNQYISLFGITVAGLLVYGAFSYRRVFTISVEISRTKKLIRIHAGKSVDTKRPRRSAS